MNKEYIYNIDKYTIGVDENGKDEIGLTIAIIKNGEINFLGNYYGENARCIDLLIEENNELKKQLEGINKMIEKCGFVNIEQVMLNYCGLLSQQKELIKYLEDKIYSIEPKGTGIIYNCEYDSEDDYVMAMREQSRLNTLKEILQKYKEIIGNDINVGSKGGNKDE